MTLQISPLIAKDASIEAAAILCRAVPAPLTAAGVMMYMPGGTNEISPSQNGKPVRVKVLADPQGAAAIERQRAAIVAKGGRPFFDFGHKDEEASFWPEEFLWMEQPEPGIYCRGEWSASGKDAIEGKLWRQFSPVFFVDDVKAQPARIICNEQAGPNMGGLVNKPAFKTIMPLWSKEAAGEDAASQRESAALHSSARALAAAVGQLSKI